MKNKQMFNRSVRLIFIIAFFCFPLAGFSQGQSSFPWTKNQVIEPAGLAGKINSQAAKNLLILNIGSVNDIKGAVYFGPIDEKGNKKKLTEYLKNVPKDTAIVMYCGCCPMTVCPNIKPAFNYIKKLGFTNLKILDLKESLVADWISKGYPMSGKAEK